MHRIFMDVTIGNGLESDDLEELAYYNWLIKEIDDMKKNSIKRGVFLNWGSKKE